MHPLRPLAVVALVALALVALPAAASAAPVNATPTTSGPFPPAEPNPEPSISGLGQVGGTLTGNRGRWAADVQLSSQWIRCATANSGCETTGDTDLSYTLTAADQGKVIKLRVTGRNAVPALGSREADASVGPIAPAPSSGSLPANVKAPEIDGTVREGELLTGSPGVWTGLSPITFGYSWNSCVADVSSCVTRASGQTYRPTAADIGRRLALVVTGTNAAGARQAVVFSSVVGKRSTVKTYKRMSPFPVLVIGGRVAGRVTTISSMRLTRVPKGSIVNTACTGKGCPYRKSRSKVRKSGTVRIKRLERRMRAGLTLVITVRQPDRIGKYVRLRLRNGSAPARVDRCVRPGSSKPISCG